MKLLNMKILSMSCGMSIINGVPHTIHLSCYTFISISKLGKVSFVSPQHTKKCLLMHMQLNAIGNDY